jgi:hypothetical protein
VYFSSTGKLTFSKSVLELFETKKVKKIGKSAFQKAKIELLGQIGSKVPKVPKWIAKMSASASPTLPKPRKSGV